MKFRLLIFFVATAITGFSQDTLQANIITATKKNEGIYKTFYEFRSNSPSIKGNLRATDFYIEIFNDTSQQFENYKEKFWGACIRDTVYIFFHQDVLSQKPTIYPLQLIGRYCYFEAFVTYYAPNLMASSHHAEYVMIMNNGKIYKLSKSIMRTILEKDPDLLKKFNKERSKKSKFKKYIEELNSKHRDDIQSSQVSTAPR